MFVVAALDRGDRTSHGTWRRWRSFCLVGVGYYAQWLTNRTREFITMERQVLSLTRPGEPVMDYKGETIYRRRPYYFILEFITRNAIAARTRRRYRGRGLVRRGCHVAQADGPQWPDRARAISCDANFLNLGRLRASGQWLAPDGSFTIAIPGEYVILDEAWRSRAGLLDGTPYRGARALAAGVHTLQDRAAGRAAGLPLGAGVCARLLAVPPARSRLLMDLNRTLVIAPHPDDESIAAGGLLQRAIAAGGEVRVVVVTDGDNNPWPLRYLKKKAADHRCRSRGMGQRCAARSRAARWQRLGVPLDRSTFLGYPDRLLTTMARGGDLRVRDAIAAVDRDLCADAARRSPRHSISIPIIAPSAGSRMTVAKGRDDRHVRHPRTSAA